MHKDKYNKWIIPKDYKICYDKNKNYNELFCDEGDYLPPYRSSDFASIYDGIQVEMHIVNHCNLNCNCCNHFSPLAEPWFIDLEDFQNQIIALKENIPSLKSFLILGGEPTLHPQLFEICMAARNILGPDIYIDVLSNGTILDKIFAHEQEYLENNINFTFSSYYQYTNIDKIKTLGPFSRIFNTRILSKQTIVKEDGMQDKYYNFFNCINYSLPCFTLKDYKLFICPFSAHLDIYCKKANINIEPVQDQDYLNINDIQGDLDKIQTFCFTPKNICSFCGQCTSVPYSDSKRDITEFNTSIDKLYFSDYDRYENIINGGTNGLIQWATNEKLNPGRIDLHYEPHEYNRELLRYKTGKIDIIIPYYNETENQLRQLRDNLLQQSIIEDCVIYFISDNSKMDLGLQWLFEGCSKLHCVFLKNTYDKGPGGARNKGIDNSFNKYLLFLDADSAFINNTALEDIYNKIHTEDLDLISWRNYDKYNKNQQGYCLNRDILNNYNLRFADIQFGEDFEFYIRLCCSINQNKIFNYDNLTNIFIEYNATSVNNNITSNFIYYDKLHFAQLTSGFIGLVRIKDNIINQDAYLISEESLVEQILLVSKEQKFLKENVFIKYLVQYELSKLAEINPSIKNHFLYQSLIAEYQIDQYQNMNDIKKFILNYLNNNYLNNHKLQYNINFIKELIEGEL